MAKPHPHAEASYRLVPQETPTFGVEVSIPGSYPALVTGFATEAAAEAWIAAHRLRPSSVKRAGFRVRRGAEERGT
jgi:hypothetical protein